MGSCIINAALMHFIESKPMGESKRRKEQDPNYGKKSQPPRQQKKPRFDIASISRTELIIWTVMFGILLATFAWTYTLQ